MIDSFIAQGGGLCPAPPGKVRFHANFRWFRNPSPLCKGGPMCPPVGGSREGTRLGRHTGRPLQSRLQCPASLEERAGTESRPYRAIAVRSSGPMYLRHGFRQPNFVPKFGASVMGIGPYGKEEKPPQPPWPAAQSGASAPRMGGRDGNRGKDHPQSVQQPRTIPQLRHSRDSSCCGAQNSLLADRSQNFDRSHSLTSLHLPPAALGSLPLCTREPWPAGDGADIARSSECPATPGRAGQSPPPTRTPGVPICGPM